MDPELETELKQAYADKGVDQIRADLEASKFAGMIDVELVAAYVAAVANG
jgi:hypothetical protein